MSAPKLTRAECIAERKSTAETARKLLKLLPAEAVTRESMERMAVQAEAAVYYLTPTAAIPNQRTKVGDRVRVCSTWIDEAQISGPFEVLEISQFLGVRTVHGWIHSWVRVKGGSQ